MKTTNIKKLDINELKLMAGKLRNEIIDTCARNGGYLASNLSGVEITLALHHVFDENDKYFFNGPKNNYTQTLIKKEEISNEYRNNALANALGECIGRDIDHNDYNVISVINSQDVLTGSNINALNMIGLQKSKMVIVYNDDISIDNGIGFVDRFISNLRNTKTYNNLKDNVKEFLKPQKGGEKIIESIHNFKSNIKRNVIDEGMFGEYGIDYIGPVDGHNFQELIRAFEIAKAKDYPCVVHCISQKGKGYIFAESSTNEAWDYCGPFNVKSGKTLINEDEDNIRCSRVISNAIVDHLENNEEIVVISTDNQNDASLTNIIAKYSDSCIDIYSVENSLSIACSLAHQGKIPFVCMNTSKIPYAYDTLINEVSNIDKPLIIGLLDNTNNYDLLKNLNINIIEPSSYDELLNAFELGLSINKPLIIKYSNNLVKINKKYKKSKLDLGKWQKIVNNVIGSKVIISTGLDLDVIEKTIKSNNYKYTLINANFLNPIDDKLVKEIFSKAKYVYVNNSVIYTKLIEASNLKQFKGQIKLIDSKNIKSFFKQIEGNK